MENEAIDAMEKGCPMDHIFEHDGLSLVHQACKYGSIKVLQYLVSHGAHGFVYCQDETPLTLVCKNDKNTEEKNVLIADMLVNGKVMIRPIP